MCWELSDALTPNVAVAVRFDEALWPAASRADHHLFRMLDDRVHGAAGFTRTFGDRDGIVVTASKAMQYRLYQSGLEINSTCIPLPLETHRYRNVEQPRHRACLWSSMPNRGLDVALAIWPKIHKAVPEAELWITSGWKLWGYTNSEADDRWKQIIGDQPLPQGVELYGTVSRQRLITLQQRGWLTLYPSRFPEMFCLTAAESAAAGTRKHSAHGLTWADALPSGC